MAQIIAIVSLGFLVTATALVWIDWKRPTDGDAGASPTSLSISDVGLKVDARSLPVQEIQDNSTVYSAGQDR